MYIIFLFHGFKRHKIRRLSGGKSVTSIISYTSRRNAGRPPLILRAFAYRVERSRHGKELDRVERTRWSVGEGSMMYEAVNNYTYIRHDFASFHVIFVIFADFSNGEKKREGIFHERTRHGEEETFHYRWISDKSNRESHGSVGTSR